MHTNFYHNLAFPWMLFDHEGQILEEGEGSLFQIEITAKSEKNIRYLSSIKEPGWSTDPIGWAVYAKRIPEGMLIFPGLKVHGISRISGKSSLLQIKISSADLENHIAKILSLAEFSQESSGSLIRSLIHEIRTANSAIKNAAYELYTASLLDEKRRQALGGNIHALSEILSARLDAQDILSAYNSVKDRPKDRVHVYKKFDKLARSYIATAQQKNIRISLEGASSDYTLGPDPFEIVPFLLIENAIKYAPSNSNIICKIERRDDSTIACSVESHGPRISDDESEKIFAAGYRGRHAKEKTEVGDGLGLALLKKTVEDLYNGTVHVEPSKQASFEINNQSYYHNKFICYFPICKPDTRIVDRRKR